jgi:hypothetical protein
LVGVYPGNPLVWRITITTLPLFDVARIINDYFIVGLGVAGGLDRSPGKILERSLIHIIAPYCDHFTVACFACWLHHNNIPSLTIASIIESPELKCEQAIAFFSRQRVRTSDALMS